MRSDKQTRRRRYSPVNPPESVEVAKQSITALERNEEHIRVAIDTKKREDFSDNDAFDRWLASAQRALAMTRKERRFLIGWIQERFPDFLPARERRTEEIIENLRAKAQEMADAVKSQCCQKYSLAVPPQNVGVAQARTEELLVAKTHLEACVENLRAEWEGYPSLDEDRYRNVKGPLQYLMGSVTTELAVLAKFLREHGKDVPVKKQPVAPPPVKPLEVFQPPANMKVAMARLQAIDAGKSGDPKDSESLKSLPHLDAERKFLVQWIRQWIPSFTPEGGDNLEIIVTTITTRAEEAAREIRNNYSHKKRLPADVVLAQARLDALLPVKRRVQAHTAELKQEWFRYQLNSARFSVAVHPLFNLVGEVGSEIGVLQAFIREQTEGGKIKEQRASSRPIPSPASSLITKQQLAKLRDLNQKNIVTVAMLDLFLSNPGVVWVGVSAVTVSRMVAASAKNMQERARMFSHIFRVTKEEADLQEVIRAWEACSDNAGTREDIGDALVDAYVAVEDFDRAATIARALEGSGALLKIAEESEAYDDEIRHRIAAESDPRLQLRFWSSLTDITENAQDLAALEQCFRAQKGQESDGRQTDWQRSSYIRGLLALGEIEKARGIIAEIRDAEIRLSALAHLAQETEDQSDAVALMEMAQSLTSTGGMHYRSLIEVAEACVACNVHGELRRWAKGVFPSDACIIFSYLATLGKSMEEDLRQAILVAESMPRDGRANVALYYFAEALAAHGRIADAKKVVGEITDQRFRCKAALAIYKKEMPQKAKEEDIE